MTSTPCTSILISACQQFFQRTRARVLPRANRNSHASHEDIASFQSKRHRCSGGSNNNFHMSSPVELHQFEMCNAVQRIRGPCTMQMKRHCKRHRLSSCRGSPAVTEVRQHSALTISFSLGRPSTRLDDCRRIDMKKGDA